ncbi:MAG: acyl-CoA desaturase [Bacteroidia bacterium]|nr:acyl-CoA desaturase [Bacteroidia bacterium]
MVRVSFNNRNAVFLQTLRERVDAYFASQNIKPSGDYRLYLKTAVLILAAVALYIVLVFFTPAPPIAILLCVLMGFSFSSIGFNVMHDGAHGSYSSIPWVNEIMARSLEVMGGSTFMWRFKHNVVHHTYTNIDGMDDDIDVKPFMRISPTQPVRGYHRFQHIYWVFFYAIMLVFWVFYADFQKYFARKIGEMDIKKMTPRDHVEFWLGKVLHFSLFVGIPIWQVGLVPVIIGYFTVLLVAGFGTSIVFQLAHVVEETQFPVPTGDPARIENEWAIHQVVTTANFATRNKLISWLMGGLNFQIEHHLFPKISHVHYPQISKIVKEICAMYNIPYTEYPTMLSSIRSHVRHLKQMRFA